MDPELVDLDVEVALLAILVNNNRALARIRDIVKPEHFARLDYGDLYAAICRRVDAGELANVLTLHEEFPAAWLAKIAASVVTMMGGTEYAERIRDLALRRIGVTILDETRNRMVTRLDMTAAEAATAAINQLRDVMAQGADGLQSFDDVAEQWVGQRLKPTECYSTGLPRVDQAMGGGLYAGHLYGLNARKKAGKTLFLGTISFNLIKLGVPHLFVPMEMTPSQIMDRMAARALGINPIVFVKGPSREIMNRAADWISTVRRKTVWFAHRPGATLQELKALASRAQARHGVKGMLIDYHQLLQGRTREESREEFQGRSAQELADFCRFTGLWCWLASQANQEGNTRGGEGLRLAVDLLWTLHRDIDSRTAWLEMGDARHVPHQNLGSDLEAALWLINGSYFHENEDGKDL